MRESAGAALLAIDLGGTAIKVGVLDGAGLVLGRDEIPVSGDPGDLERAAASAGQLITSLGRPVAAAGIALPGVVDRAAGTLIRAHEKYGYLGRRDLRAWGAEVLGVPTVIENDARAALVGEISFGCARGASDAVIITLGTGIGTAAVIGGELLRGRHDHAGILGGHVTVQFDGDPCNCGNLGCAEAEASTWSLARDLDRHPRRADSALAGSDRPGLAELFSAPAVDPVADELRTRYLTVWGATVVTLCHAYDPEVVIVSGGVLRARDRVLPVLTDHVHRHLWSSAHRPELITPDHPEDSVLRGLAALAGSHSAARSA
ncbi:ROK family protein [Microlunatus speluncae]|uniref:ROK family protein n=1 Tax=Microlunatus speluncae TaxID=2594267 RepID=UPI001376253C|nr:ROK family protein [Microlunatus speluncae]